MWPRQTQQIQHTYLMFDVFPCEAEAPNSFIAPETQNDGGNGVRTEHEGRLSAWGTGELGGRTVPAL